jgi:hypothetical protein
MRVTYYLPHHRESDPRQRGYRIFCVLCYFRWFTWWGAVVTWFSLQLRKECESCPARFRYCVTAIYVYNAGGRHFGPRGRHLSAAETKCCFVPNRGSNNTDHTKSFCPSSNITTGIKPEKTTCAGHVARIGEMRNAQHKTL